jgi:hypothetical protein
MIAGDPEAKRLGLPMVSVLEAMVGQNYYKAGNDETTPAFHGRISAMVKAKGKPYANIILSDPENAEPPKGSTFNDDGSPKLPEGPHILN